MVVNKGDLVDNIKEGVDNGNCVHRMKVQIEWVQVRKDDGLSCPIARISRAFEPCILLMTTKMIYVLCPACYTSQVSDWSSGENRGMII